MAVFFVYALCLRAISTALDRYYTGETIDVSARLIQHNLGHYKGTSTSLTDDWKLFLQIECKDRSIALKLERFIKKQEGRKFIEKLKNEPGVIESVSNRIGG